MSVRNANRVPAVLALAAILLGVSACGEPPAPIVVGQAPATATARVDLDIPETREGFLPFDRWPKACELLTDADVTAIFPQATDLTRKTSSQEIRIGPSLRDLRPGPRYNVTINDAACEIHFSLPGAELDPDLLNATGWAVHVDVLVAGSDEVVQQNVSKADAAHGVGSTPCVAEDIGSSLTCTAPRLGFVVGVRTIGNQGKIDGEYTVRYEHAGEVTTFKTATENRARLDYERRVIAPELVKAVVAKL